MQISSLSSAAPAAAGTPQLSIDGLSVAHRTSPHNLLVSDVSLQLPPGGALGIVGESGSGKSLTCLSIMDLLPGALWQSAGSIRMNGAPLAPGRKGIRGRRIAMIFQDPGATMNPLRRIGPFLSGLVKLHRGLTGAAAEAEAVRLLDAVRMPAARERLRAYPHELSGGQNQRVMIAGALASDPEILLADEPTTALDVTTQAQILDLLAELRAERGMGLVLVSHDFGVIAEAADHVAVMRAGRVVEQAPANRLFSFPQHPYTASLLTSIPPELGRASVLTSRKSPPRNRPSNATKGIGIEARGLSRLFEARGRARVHALNGIDLTIQPGEMLGIVGESGCGKSTFGRLLVGLDKPSFGDIRADGKPLVTDDGEAFRNSRRRLQLVWQDPLSVLNPRLSIGYQIIEVLQTHRITDDTHSRMLELLQAVNLKAEHASRYAHQLSGGQRQRAVIARALAVEPQIVVFDEPVSALDLSVQAQVIEMIADIRNRFELTGIFISHDIRVVRYVSDRIAVMYLGRIVEIGPADDIYHTPKHPYTQALLSAVLSTDPKRRKSRSILRGDPPDPAQMPSGCPFHPRCPRAAARCRAETPALQAGADSRFTACHAVDVETSGRHWEVAA
ncbi:ABC transporter ATP-binding protein [Hoeflea sp. CAU 1731]